MTPDFRALCAELADAYLRTLEHINNSTWLGYEPSDEPLLQRARALLAQPESIQDRIAAADAAIEASMKRIRALAAPALADLLEPQPVAVSERLPSAADCDAEGLCWWWDPECEQTEGWIRGLPEYCNNNRSHWLPAHALPTPEATND